MRPRPTSLTASRGVLVFTLLGVVSAIAGARAERVAGQTEEPVVIHMPLAVSLAGTGELHLPPAQGPGDPTAPPASATPGASPTFPPTATDVPTPTATPAGEGRIEGRLLIDGGPAYEGLGVDLGPGLFLLRCRPGDTMADCARIDRTGVVGDEGGYAFVDPPALDPGAYYVVHWRNETQGGLFNDHTLIGAWYSERITPFAAGDERNVEPVELRNFQLTGPSKGTGYSGLPWTFTWDTRSGVEESYRWTICDCCGDAEIAERESPPWQWQSPSVGSRGSYTLNSYPPGLRIGIENKYCWYVHAQHAGNSYTWSNERWMLWFFFDALEVFGLVDGSEWGWGPGRLVR